MNISEIIELTKTKTIAEIARDHLTIGEKPAREALHLAGCYSIKGQRGWFFDESENPDNLHKSIYVFAEQAKEQKEEELKLMANVDSKVDVEVVPRKRHSFDLDVRLVKKLRVHCAKSDLRMYEAVETAIYEYLERETGDLDE